MIHRACSRAGVGVLMCRSSKELSLMLLGVAGERLSRLLRLTETDMRLGVAIELQRVSKRGCKLGGVVQGVTRGASGNLEPSRSCLGVGWSGLERRERGHTQASTERGLRSAGTGSTRLETRRPGETSRNLVGRPSLPIGKTLRLEGCGLPLLVGHIYKTQWKAFPYPSTSPRVL